MGLHIDGVLENDEVEELRDYTEFCDDPDRRDGERDEGQGSVDDSRVSLSILGEALTTEVIHR